jgi:hypothetical protein
MLTVIKAGEEHSVEQCGEVSVITQPYKGITRGWGEFMALYTHDKSEWVSYQPHDVIVNYGQILSAISQSPVAMFQLALSKDSYGSHGFTYAKGRTGWHDVPFVEAMMPVFRWDFYKIVAPVMGESKSGWGLDHLWADLHRKTYGVSPMICCNYVMKHTEPVRSQHFVIDGKTSMHEMHLIKQKYQL